MMRVFRYFSPLTKEELLHQFHILFKLRTLFYHDLTSEERKGCDEKLRRFFLFTGKSPIDCPLTKEDLENEKVANILPLHHFTGVYLDHADVTPDKLHDFLLSEKAFSIPILREIYGDIARISSRDLERLSEAGATRLDLIKYMIVNHHAAPENHEPKLIAARNPINLVNATIRWKQTGKIF